VEAIPKARKMIFGGIEHSGGMCDSVAFHEAVDDLTDDAAKDLPDCKWDELRGYVLMTILWMIIPAGKA
jgi:hypothetical protein